MLDSFCNSEPVLNRIDTLSKSAEHGIGGAKSGGNAGLLHVIPEVVHLAHAPGRNSLAASGWPRAK